MNDQTKANVVSLDRWGGRIMCPVCNPETRRRPFFEGHCIVCDEEDTITAIELARGVVELMRKLDESVTVPLERAASELGLAPTTDVASAVLRECESARRAVGQAWFSGSRTLTDAIERKCAALEREILRSAE
jgi:hypothetical protein